MDAAVETEGVAAAWEARWPWRSSRRWGQSQDAEPDAAAVVARLLAETNGDAASARAERIRLGMQEGREEEEEDVRVAAAAASAAAELPSPGPRPAMGGTTSTQVRVRVRVVAAFVNVKPTAVAFIPVVVVSARGDRDKLPLGTTEARVSSSAWLAAGLVVSSSTALGGITAAAASEDQPLPCGRIVVWISSHVSDDATPSQTNGATTRLIDHAVAECVTQLKRTLGLLSRVEWHRFRLVECAMPSVARDIVSVLWANGVVGQDRDHDHDHDDPRSAARAILGMAPSDPDDRDTLVRLVLARLRGHLLSS